MVLPPEAYVCPKCRNRLDAGAGNFAEEAAASAATLLGQPVVRPAHYCGACGALLYADAGAMRPLTPAEVFGLEMEIPAALAFTRSIPNVPGESSVVVEAYPERT